MADIEQALYSILSNDGTVSGLVSTRIYPLLIPQDSALPAVQYQRISTQRVNPHAAASTLARARFQVTSIAANYDTVCSVADAIRGALDGYMGTAASVRIDGAMMENELDEYGLTNDIYIIRQDVIFWHGES